MLNMLNGHRENCRMHVVKVEAAIGVEAMKIDSIRRRCSFGRLASGAIAGFAH